MNQKLANALERIVKDDTRLAVICRPCEEFDKEYLSKCARDLLTTAQTLNKGKIKCAGLAANQLGYECRMFVIRTAPGRFTVYEDPVVVSNSGTVKKSTEGCFSRPGIYQTVDRFTAVKVRRGESGAEHTYSGEIAVAFQHELDHLNGVLI